MRPSALLKGLKQRWDSSLSVRMIAATLLVTNFILLVGGWMVMTLAQRGIVEAKQETSAHEASYALRRMQRQLSNATGSSESTVDRLGHIADEVSEQPREYSVIIETNSSVLLGGGVRFESIPDGLRAEMATQPEQLWQTLSLIEFTNGSTMPGVIVGGHLVSASGQHYPVFFCFPMVHESQTLSVLSGAFWTVYLFLVIALAFIAYFLTRRISTPIEEVSRVASTIAAGDFGQRVEVQGSDEIASLGASMNHMAESLEEHIEALETMTQVQRRFVSDVSHELRTPLTTMKMASDVLYEARHDLAAPHKRTVELLAGEIDRFGMLLAELLEISRFDANAAHLDTAPGDVEEIVRDEIEGLARLALQQGTEITLTSSGDVNAAIDAGRIRRIVRNLLSNAIAHGRHRPIDVTIRADETAVAVRVRDHGVGLSPEEQLHVFDRFWRADASRNRMIGGTGLGLAIAKQDAELHGGWLDVAGEPGVGASFRLTIPKHRDVELTSSPLEVNV